MEEELKSFGLTDNEIKIYIALLSLGTASPAQIAEKTGFSRSYIYDALERLLEKEMVSSVLKNNKKHYTATDPKRLEILAKQRLFNIQKIIPKLESFQNLEKENINVELHRGTYVYKTMLKDILSTLKNNSEVLIFGIDDDILMNLDKHYLTHVKQYFNQAYLKHIKERIIIKEKGNVLKEAKTSAYRFLPKKVFGNTAFEVYGNKVAILLWGRPHHLILIESKEVAESYRKQFGLIWKLAKDE